jgi:hypothetical protein
MSKGLTLNYIVLLLNSAQCPMTLIRHGVTIEALEKEGRRGHNEDIIQTKTKKKEDRSATVSGS